MATQRAPIPEDSSVSKGDDENEKGRASQGPSPSRRPPASSGSHESLAITPVVPGKRSHYSRSVSEDEDQAMLHAHKRQNTGVGEATTGVMRIDVNTLRVTELERAYEALKVENTSAKERLQALESQTELQAEALNQALDQLETFKQTFSQDLAAIEESVSCVVCTERMWYPYLLPKCGHCFCESCLAGWFRTCHPNLTCPYCRSPVREKPAELPCIKNITEAVARAQSRLDDSDSSQPERVQEARLMIQRLFSDQSSPFLLANAGPSVQRLFQHPIRRRSSVTIQGGWPAQSPFPLESTHPLVQSASTALYTLQQTQGLSQDSLARHRRPVSQPIRPPGVSPPTNMRSDQLPSASSEGTVQFISPPNPLLHRLDQIRSADTNLQTRLSNTILHPPPNIDRSRQMDRARFEAAMLESQSLFDNYSF